MGGAAGERPPTADPPTTLYRRGDPARDQCAGSDGHTAAGEYALHSGVREEGAQERGAGAVDERAPTGRRVDVGEFVADLEVEMRVHVRAAQFPRDFQRQQPFPVQGHHRRPRQRLTGVVGFGVGLQDGTDAGDGIEQVAAQGFPLGGQVGYAQEFEGGYIEGGDGVGGVRCGYCHAIRSGPAAALR